MSTSYAHHARTFTHYGRRVVEEFSGVKGARHGIMCQTVFLGRGHEFKRYATMHGASDTGTIERMRREVRDVIYLLAFGYHGDAVTNQSPA